MDSFDIENNQNDHMKKQNDNDEQRNKRFQEKIKLYKVNSFSICSYR